MQEEVTRFFVYLFQHDRSVSTLLDADYTFLNKPLADHYGIPFEGDGWQRVEGLRTFGRGGALGFSATLAKHSGASRTSAILRGMWVSEVLLGDKIPNPPKGVPTLPEEAPEGLSERQLIERHSSDARCAGCHKRIDPLRFRARRLRCDRSNAGGRHEVRDLRRHGCRRPGRFAGLSGQPASSRFPPPVQPQATRLLTGAKRATVRPTADRQPLQNGRRSCRQDHRANSSQSSVP